MAIVWRTSAAIGLAAFVLVAACDTQEPKPTEIDVSADLAAGPATATGGGHFLITILGGLPGKLGFSTVQVGPGLAAEGQMRIETVLQGEQVEFHGRATCLAVDPENNRAWIGGVVTRNASTHPAFMTEIHEPGKDIWFRVVDYGEGDDAEQPDRTTFVGFEGAAGIITSAEYCEAQIWPDNDERTWAMTAGDIKVRD
jgi:hypothetical protein